MDIQCYYLWLPILQIVDINGNNMNRDALKLSSRLHGVYVKFFEIRQKDANTGWGKELKVWISDISGWEDEDSVEWLSWIEGDESLAQERIDGEYINNSRHF